MTTKLTTVFCLLAVTGNAAAAALDQWQGANAFTTWLADLRKHDEAAGVTDGRVTLGAPIRQEVAGDRAYVVLNVTYSIKSRGVPAQAAAQMTFALRRETKR